MVNATTGLANRNEAVNQIVSENEHRVAYIFEDLIKRGLAQGEIDASQDAKVLSSYIFSSLQGLRVLAITNSDLTTLRRVKDTVLSAVFVKEDSSDAP